MTEEENPRILSVAWEVTGDKKLFQPGHPKLHNKTTKGMKLKNDPEKMILSRIGNMTLGSHSKLLATLRKSCNNCPLGEKKLKIKVGDKEIDRTKQAICPYYQKDNTECKLPTQDMIQYLKVLKEVLLIDDKQFIQNLLMKTVAFGEIAAEKEILEKGAPGYYAREFLELSLKYANELRRIDTAQKIEVSGEVKVDLSKQIIEAYQKRVVDLKKEVVAEFKDVTPVETNVEEKKGD